MEAVTTALSLALAGKPTEAIAAGAASPYVNQAIKTLTEQNEVANIAAHILWGAIEAELSGGKASTGAVAAGVAELGARALTQGIYQKEPSELSLEEKEQLLEITKALSGVVAGATTKGNTAETLSAVSTGSTIAKNAVENNYLYNGEVDNLARELAQAEREGKDTKSIFEKYAKLSEKNRQAILSECGDNPVCYLPHIQMMNSGNEAAYEHSSKLRLTSYVNGLSSEMQVKLSDFVEQENAKTRSQLPQSLHYASLALGAAEAIGLGGLALKDKLPKISLSGKTKSYPSSGMDNHQRQNVGDVDYPQIVVSKSKYPESALHIEEALKNGKPDILTIDRKGAKARRKEALKDIPIKSGLDRDEYPPALFKEGGEGASVKHINPSDNRGSGKCIGNQCKDLNDGDKVKIIVED